MSTAEAAGSAPVLAHRQPIRQGEAVPDAQGLSPELREGLGRLARALARNLADRYRRTGTLALSPKGNREREAA